MSIGETRISFGGGNYIYFFEGARTFKTRRPEKIEGDFCEIHFWHWSPPCLNGKGKCPPARPPESAPV